MFNRLMSVRIIKLTLFAISVEMLTAGFLVAAGAAKDKPLSKSELKHLIVSAETKAEHERIAQYFDAEAARYEAESKEHGELAQLYQQTTSSTPTKYPGSVQSFQHCDSLSKSLKKSAEDARQLAAEHRRMANQPNK